MQPVTPHDFATRSQAAASHSSPHAHGLFGPASMSWRVNRESALFLAAGRASLLQLAHPWVAVALDQHSSIRRDPLARFHNTFRLVFPMVFGTTQQALAASRHLYGLHTRIQGTLPETAGSHAQGSPYMANEVEALLWVFATLVESALVAHDAVLPPLTAAEREQYYADSLRLAALFGIPAAALPASWSAFQRYFAVMISSSQLSVAPLALDLAHGVLHGTGTWLPVPGWYRALTAYWMPEPLRTAFAPAFGPAFGPADSRAHTDATARRALRYLAASYRHWPAPVRFVGPYREAHARLHGRRPGPLTRLSNRFWTGAPRMLFAPPKA